MSWSLVTPLTPAVFWPLLDEYCRLHPQVQPDVELDDWIGNWVEAQPLRVRAFIDLAVERLADNPDFVLAAEELAAAEAKGRAAIPGAGSAP